MSQKLEEAPAFTGFQVGTQQGFDAWQKVFREPAVAREDFERVLGEVAADAEAVESFEHVTAATLRALRELEKDRDAIGRGTDRVFTYEHPVLAVALQRYEQAIRGGLSGRLVHRWIAVGIAALLSRNDRDFVQLASLQPGDPIDLGSDDDVRIAVVGDAGYLCPAQKRVIELMKAQVDGDKYPLLIHLGDTYFGGSDAEMFTNLIAPLSQAPAERLTTLCGNHDLYFGPEPFIRALQTLRQPGRYFAVQAAGWTIACLDTSLAAATVLRHDGLLDVGQVAWLEKLAGKVKGRRLILMGHHPPISDWEGASDEMREQIHDAILKKVALWYWGHEHRIATYASDTWKGAVVGNGAFQESVGGPRRKPGRVEWYPEDAKCDCYGSSFFHGDEWPHGFLELTLRPDSVEERYVLETGDVHTRTTPAA
jgi:hypothetical protein